MINVFSLAFICASMFLIVLISVQFIRKDLSPSNDVLSKYVNGRFGWILSAGFYSIALAEFLLAFGLMEKNAEYFPAVFLIISGIGALLVVLFKIELGEKQSIKGRVHWIGGGMQFIFFPISVLLFMQTLDEGAFLEVSRVTAIFTLFLTLIITVVSIKNLTHSLKYFGYIQKINIFIMSSWVAYASFMLI